jgi:hypothetical protein
MSSSNAVIRSVFGHFQNLNLLALIHDLRNGRTARGNWSTGADLCPVAHGMPIGRLVSELCYLGQTDALERSCAYAARQLGADLDNVRRFVELWDTLAFSAHWFLRQLEAIWEERFADAVAVQELLEANLVQGRSSRESDHV